MISLIDNILKSIIIVLKNQGKQNEYVKNKLFTSYDCFFQRNTYVQIQFF